MSSSVVVYQSLYLLSYHVWASPMVEFASSIHVTNNSYKQEPRRWDGQLCAKDAVSNECLFPRILPACRSVILGGPRDSSSMGECKLGTVHFAAWSSSNVWSSCPEGFECFICSHEEREGTTLLLAMWKWWVDRSSAVS